MAAAAAPPAAPLPGYGTRQTVVEVMEVAVHADTARLGNVRENTGDIDSVYLEGGKVAHELITLEERGVQVASQTVPGPRGRLGAADVMALNRPYLLRALRIQRVVDVIQDLLQVAEDKSDQAADQMWVVARASGPREIRDAAIYELAETGENQPANMHIPAEAIDDDDNFLIRGNHREAILHYAAMGSRLRELERVWGRALQMVMQTLRTNAYGAQIATRPVDDQPGLYYEGHFPVVIIPIAGTDSYHWLHSGEGKRPVVRVGKSGLRPMRAPRFDSDRPSRILLPARIGRPDSELRVYNQHTITCSPRHIMRTFPPELMLGAFPHDDRYRGFVEWYNTVATPDDQTGFEGAMRNFSTWYAAKVKSESLFNRGALSRPNMDTGQTIPGTDEVMAGHIARKLNAVRSRVLYASMNS